MPDKNLVYALRELKVARATLVLDLIHCML